MNDFFKGYILAYFKDRNNDYSFHDLAKSLGISIEKIDEVITSLVQEEDLAYNEKHTLNLTAKGRMMILNCKEDYVKPPNNILLYNIIEPDSAWPIDRAYVPETFTSKL